jgi:hypothetical protein
MIIMHVNYACMALTIKMGTVFPISLSVKTVMFNSIHRYANYAKMGILLVLGMIVYKNLLSLVMWLTVYPVTILITVLNVKKVMNKMIKGVVFYLVKLTIVHHAMIVVFVMGV